MKATLAILICLIGTVAIAQDISEVRAAAILKNELMVGIVGLLNEKGGKCILPMSSSDIKWYCGGLLLPPKEPEIQPSGCGFSVDVNCESEVFRVYGSERSYFLNTYPERNDVKPTQTQIVIESFKKVAK